jgi:putative phage-type endonuclease
MNTINEPVAELNRPVARLPERGWWGCPAASPVAGAELSREAWLAARRSGVGGSELAAVLGESRYRTAFDVWRDKTGRTVESDMSEAMRWGMRLESAIADGFAEEHRLQVRSVGLLRSRRCPRMLATVDRLTSDGGGLEVKSTGFFAGRQLAEGAMPREWFWQLVHYLAVTGRAHWWLAALVGGQRLEVRRLDRGDVAAEMARAVAAVGRFWTEHVDADTAPEQENPLPPAVEAGVRAEAALPDAVAADVARWRELLVDCRDADAELAAIKARLGTEIGTGQLLTVRGAPVVRQVTRAAGSRFDRAGLRAAHPEIEKQFTTVGAPSRYVDLIRKETRND